MSPISGDDKQHASDRVKIAKFGGLLIIKASIYSNLT